MLGRPTPTDGALGVRRDVDAGNSNGASVSSPRETTADDVVVAAELGPVGAGELAVQPSSNVVTLGAGDGWGDGGTDVGSASAGDEREEGVERDDDRWWALKMSMRVEKRGDQKRESRDERVRSPVRPADGGLPALRDPGRRVVGRRLPVRARDAVPLEGYTEGEAESQRGRSTWIDQRRDPRVEKGNELDRLTTPELNASPPVVAVSVAREAREETAATEDGADEVSVLERSGGSGEDGGSGGGEDRGNGDEGGEMHAKRGCLVREGGGWWSRR
jgi:hypothetical protein